MDATKEMRKKNVAVIEVDEQELRAHVSEVVCQRVEETLNRLLDAADEYDGDTLKGVLAQVTAVRGHTPETALCDRGF